MSNLCCVHLCFCDISAWCNTLYLLRTYADTYNFDSTKEKDQG